MHDIISNISIEQSLAPQTLQASALSTGDIDMQGCETLAVVVMLGAIADTLDSTHRIDVKIEHAEDDGTGAPDSYAPCADADVLNFANLSSGVFLSVDAAGKAQKRYAIGYRGGRRFVKVTATPVSLATGGPVALLALKGNAHQSPVSST